MQVIEFYSVKKICHYLMEEKYKNKEILFAVPDVMNLKIFEPVFNFLRDKYNHKNMQLGIIDTIKQREKNPKYIFINLMNVDELKRFNLIFKVPEIYDYAYFLPEIVGLSNIPTVKITDTFNYILSYYDIDKFVIINIEDEKNIFRYAKYIEYLKKKNIYSILIGNPIYCAEIVNLTDINPIVIYKKNVPLIVDLLKKCMYCVSNIPLSIKNVKYEYISFDDEFRKIN